jgi:SAM-dependent methyltransferase
MSPGFSILEIGSGPYGAGEYYPHPFVGCDLSFFETARGPMLPVVASGLQLPFQDPCFDAVIASDVMEHIPPSSRQNVLREALRVARKIAVIGLPVRTSRLRPRPAPVDRLPEAQDARSSLA